MLKALDRGVRQSSHGASHLSVRIAMIKFLPKPVEVGLVFLLAFSSQGLAQ